MPSNDYSRGYWYAAGRIDERDSSSQGMLRANLGQDVELKFGMQYEQLREDYDKNEGRNGCPSLKRAWAMFLNGDCDLIAAWKAENEKWSAP